MNIDYNMYIDKKEETNIMIKGIINPTDTVIAWIWHKDGIKDEEHEENGEYCYCDFCEYGKNGKCTKFNKSVSEVKECFYFKESNDTPFEDSIFELKDADFDRDALQSVDNEYNAFYEAVEAMFDDWWDSLSTEDKLVPIETEYEWHCYDGIDSCTIKFTAEVDVDLFYEFCGDSPAADKFARENDFKCSTNFFDEMLEIYKEQNEDNWVEKYLC